MEKQHKSAAPIMEEQHKPQSPPKSSRSRTYIALFAVYALFAFVYRSTSYLAPPTSSADPVQWHSCENDPKNPRFQCATVAVPLDYSRGFEGGTAYIALSKWVARGKIPGKPSVTFNSVGCMPSCILTDPPTTVLLCFFSDIDVEPRRPGRIRFQ